VGRYTYGIPRVYFGKALYGKKEVTRLTIGKFCEGHHITKGDVVIGNDVWIGMGAVILSGVEIGDGAVVGAASNQVVGLGYPGNQKGAASPDEPRHGRFFNILSRERIARRNPACRTPP
jgi:hypothetical protein